MTARWGVLQRLQRGDVVMPGPGRVTETSGRVVGLDSGLLDLWLNRDVCVHDVPEAVWSFTVGGYQVLKKWLSYREKSVLGRDLTLQEGRYFSVMVRRVAALLHLSPELDAAYQQAKREHVWPAE